ncbi:hypothetical protein KR054_009347 [Drosophila jambulina]|nr:hypothetical protein KR054_009347 [Drosophila jambulina]
MESSRLFLLLIGICCVILARQTQAECCRAHGFVKFQINNGYCRDVKRAGWLASAPKDCIASICADGSIVKFRFCGRGECNIFGCNCDSGCRTGDWEKSFEKKYEEYAVDVWSFHKIPF